MFLEALVLTAALQFTPCTVDNPCERIGESAPITAVSPATPFDTCLAAQGLDRASAPAPAVRACADLFTPAPPDPPKTKKGAAAKKSGGGSKSGAKTGGSKSSGGSGSDSGGGGSSKSSGSSKSGSSKSDSSDDGGSKSSGGSGSDSGRARAALERAAGAARGPSSERVRVD